ncbi:MAG TPA: neutral zinc metallopeptidase [Actinoplanes sp.]
MRRLLLAMLLVVLVGCGVSRLPGPGETTATPKPAKSGDTVTKSIQDVERFWTGEFPKLADGKKFQKVQGGYHPYTRSVPPPDCGDQPGQYQPNAFYCPAGDYIAWDAQTLIPQLESDFGSLLVGVVFAHEYGHAIQVRLGRTGQPTVVLEQQADCFAGAWLGDALAGHSKVFKTVSAKQLDNTVAGLLMLRDQPGTPAMDEGAHGNAFDRIRALQDGVQDGAGKCVQYSADNLPVTEVPFTDAADAERGGDLPYDQAVQLLSQDAQGYWERTFPQLTGRSWQDLRVDPFDGDKPSCSKPDSTAQGAAFYCPDGGFVAFDNRQLGPALYQRIGDNAVGELLGDLFARAAQDRRGRSTSGKAGQLAVDCLAGSWTYDILNRTPAERRRGGVTLSPGDLDEAVAALLAFGRAEDGSGPTAFDRIAAYRGGVLQGLKTCS